MTGVLAKLAVAAIIGAAIWCYGHASLPTPRPTAHHATTTTRPQPRQG